MRSMARFLILTAVVVLLSAGASEATQILYKTPQQIGQQSTTVVRGKVSSVQSFWNAKRTKIFTETTIVVDETYKGRQAASVRILQLGGTVDNVRVTVHGALRWSEGEEVLVYLEPYTDGAFQISGFSQGKFNIERDPITGEAFVKRPQLGGAQMVGAPDDDIRVTRIESVPLDRFVNQTLGRR